MYVLEGFVIGLGTIIFIGPVFFLLLNISLQKGVKAGLIVALGIISSDIVCVLLCYFGVSQLFVTAAYQFWLGIVGSIILFGLGISYVLKKPVFVNTRQIKSKALYSFFIKGFSVNFFNPFVFIVWVGIYKYGQLKYTNEVSMLWFLVTVLLGILVTDILKVFLSEKLRKFITSKRLKIFFRITGVILILCSIRVLYIVL
ncbi:LysE family transporter [Aquimarina addita]|uniref:LysE family transporter n=1 Tax=Aquimarina addita TaxID=870485 RepID=A0ABP6UPX6_9FLAO